eukprot:3836280-Ditylum_brightwellii.AAC.1
MGVSKESYSHSNMYPIHGGGQDIYDDEARDATFMSPDKQISTKLALMGLVDNITNQVNEFLNNEVTAQEFVLNMKQDNGTLSMIPDNLGLALTINSTNTSTTGTIKHKTIYDPYKILGCYKAPVGTNKTQYLALLQKAEKYGEKVSKSSLTYHEA